MTRIVTITTYAQADAYLGKKFSRPLHGRSTRMERRDSGRIAIRYHDTDIVTYTASGATILNSGGFKTVTTKSKINEYIPGSFRVWQDKGIWTLNRLDDPGSPWYGRRVSFGFADGITIIGDQILAFIDSIDLERQKTQRKAIAKYAQAYVDAFLLGKVQPLPGDPTNVHGLSTATIWTYVQDNRYLQGFIQEAVNVFPVSRAAYDVYALIMQEDALLAEKTLRFWGDIARRQLTSSLKRYLYRRFGTAS